MAAFSRRRLPRKSAAVAGVGTRNDGRKYAAAAFFLYFGVELQSRMLGEDWLLCFYPAGATNSITDATNYPAGTTMDYCPAGATTSLRAWEHRCPRLGRCFILVASPPFRERTCKTSDYLLETIYFGAYEASWVLAERDGVHESYIGSPANNGECCRASSCR